MDAIIRVHSQIRKYSEGFLLFVDFREAYASVKRDELLKKLREDEILDTMSIELIQFI